MGLVMVVVVRFQANLQAIPDSTASPAFSSVPFLAIANQSALTSHAGITSHNSPVSPQALKFTITLNTLKN